MAATGEPVPFFEALESRSRSVGSLLAVGLDPHPQDIDKARPGEGASDIDAARAFAFGLVDRTAEFAAAFKPNAAFFEALGAGGIELLKEVRGVGLPCVGRRIGASLARWPAVAARLLFCGGLRELLYFLWFLDQSDKHGWVCILCVSVVNAWACWRVVLVSGHGCAGD